jgi:hypothetical protein
MRDLNLRSEGTLTPLDKSPAPVSTTALSICICNQDFASFSSLSRSFSDIKGEIYTKIHSLCILKKQTN